MPDRPSADRTAELLLWYAREPARYRAEGRRRGAPVLDPEVVLRLALGRPVEFAGTALGDPRSAGVLREAAESYVRNMYFRPDATPYQVLGLEPGAPYPAIRESFRLLMQLVHPDRQGARGRWPDSCAAQANQAYAILRDKDTRRRFDEEADARAALARAINRAATAAEASRMPVVVCPKGRGKRGRSPGRPKLPEWLTSGVAGVARAHPAGVSFAVLIGVALSIVGFAMRDGQGELLTRVAREMGPSEPAPGDSRRQDVPDREAVAGAAPAAALAVDGAADSAARVVLASISPTVGLAPSRSDVVSMPPPPAADAMPAPIATLVQTATVPGAATPGSAETVSRVPHREPDAEATRAGVPRGIEVAALAPVAPVPPPASAEIEALFASFVETYEQGRVDAFASLFDDDADTNLRRGRSAIRGEYDELFRLSQSRRMELHRINWRRVGDRVVAKGEIAVRIAWRDGRDVEQRLNVDMELVRRDGHLVIARLLHQQKAP